MHILLLTLFLTLSLFSSVTLNDMESEKRYAFVISNGVDKENFNDLNIKNTKKFEKFLKSKKFTTFSAYNLKRSSLIKAFRKFDKSIAPNSIVMIVYSGQMVTLNQQNWMIPANSDIESLKQLRLGGVSLNFMLTKLQRHSPRAILTTVDGYAYKTHKNSTSASSIKRELDGINRLNQIVLWSGSKKSSSLFSNLSKTISNKTIDFNSVASYMNRYKAKNSVKISTFYFNLPKKLVTAEDRAWQRAVAKRTVVGFEAFLVAYPDSQYKEEAVGNINNIYKKVKAKAKSRKYTKSKPVKKVASAESIALQLEREKLANQQKELELLQAKLVMMASQEKIKEIEVEKVEFFEPEEMVVIPSGVFTMGSKSFKNTQPMHKVRFKKSFKLSAFEVSNKAYSAYLKATGKKYRKKKLLREESASVAYVSWKESKAYIEWLNSVSGKDYRLPTEAEWEYAARAGTDTAFYWGTDAKRAPQYAWTLKNAHGFVHTGGILQPNAFGIYDMIGNVAEWCEDAATPNYKKADSNGAEAFVDVDAMKVYRGGSYLDEGKQLSSAYRNSNIPTYKHITIGFRLAEDK